MFGEEETLFEKSVADPGYFLVSRGANPQIWGKNPLFGKIFAEHRIKMKEIGASVCVCVGVCVWGGGGVSLGFVNGSEGRHILEMKYSLFKEKINVHLFLFLLCRRRSSRCLL